jgi:hypothetical protein
MNINKITATLMLFVLFQSCGAYKINNKALLGEWISAENNRIYFSFEKNRCYYLSACANFSPYTLNDSIIIIKDTIKGPHSKEFRESKFRILKLKDNELELYTEYAPLYPNFDTLKLN